MISNRAWSNEDENLYQQQTNPKRWAQFEASRYRGTFEQWLQWRKRHSMERRVISAAVKGLLAAGRYISVFDGEEITVKRSRSIRQILGALWTTDEDYLFVYEEGVTARRGWVRLIYGESGWDVICDYTTNLEEPLTAAMALADKLSN